MGKETRQEKVYDHYAAERATRERPRVSREIDLDGSASRPVMQWSEVAVREYDLASQ